MLMYIMSSYMQFSTYLKMKWMVFRTKQKVKRAERRVYELFANEYVSPLQFQVRLAKYMELVDQLDDYNNMLQ